MDASIFKECLVSPDSSLDVIKLDPQFSLGVSFSEAKFDATHTKHPGSAAVDLIVPYAELFSKVGDVLESRLDNPRGDLHAGDDQMAYDRFLKFVHEERLAKFLKLLTKVKPEKEKEFNILVANEILQPLSGSMCVVNTDHKNAASSRNEDVKLPSEAGLQGLGMGFNGGFYGVPDMLICPPKVKAASEVKSQSGSVPVNIVSSVEHDDNESDDNDSKKQRKEETKDDSPGKTAVEEKKRAKQNPDNKELSQTFAIAISFALVQRERHPDLHTFPTLRVHPFGFEIVIYDTKFDCLMLGCYNWSERSIFYLWIVLNHKLFAIKEWTKGDEYKCGYSAVAAKRVQGDCMYLVQKSRFNDAGQRLLSYRQCKGLTAFKR